MEINKYYNKAIVALGLSYSNTCKFSQGEFIGCDEVVVIAKAKELLARDKVVADMDNILNGMSTSETIAFMFKYIDAKLGTDTKSKGATFTTSNGEDVLAWGDRMSEELGSKLKELRDI